MLSKSFWIKCLNVSQRYALEVQSYGFHIAFLCSSGLPILGFINSKFTLKLTSVYNIMICEIMFKLIFTCMSCLINAINVNCSGNCWSSIRQKLIADSCSYLDLNIKKILYILCVITWMMCVSNNLDEYCHDNTNFVRYFSCFLISIILHIYTDPWIILFNHG